LFRRAFESPKENYTIKPSQETAPGIGEVFFKKIPFLVYFAAAFQYDNVDCFS